MARKKKSTGKRKAITVASTKSLLPEKDIDGYLRFSEKVFDRELQDKFSTFLKGEVKVKGSKSSMEQETPVVHIGEKTRIDNPAISGVEKEYGVYNPSDLTIDTITRMKEDPQVSAALAFIKLPIIALPWRVECEDEKIAKTVEFALKRVWTQLISSTLTAIEYGFSSHEKVYHIEDIKVRSKAKTGKAKTFYSGRALLYKKIKSHYPDSIIINMNDKDDFVGVSQQQTQGGLVTIDAQKCFLFTHEGEFGNPFGKSRLKACYKYWYWKELMYQFMLMYFERRGSPTVVATAPLGKSTDKSGLRRENLDIALDLAGSLLSNSVAAIPYQTNKQSHENMWALNYLLDDKRGEMFIQAINHLDSSILRSVWIPDSTVGEGSSFGQASVHADLFMMAEEGLVAQIVKAINDQVVPILVEANFRPSMVRDCYVEMENLNFNRKVALKEIFLEMMRNIDNMVQIGMRPKIYPDLEAMAKVLQIPVSTLEDEIDVTNVELPDKGEDPEKKPSNVVPIDGAKSRAVPERARRTTSAGSREVDRKSLKPGGKRAEQMRTPKLGEEEPNYEEAIGMDPAIVEAMYGPEEGASVSDRLRYRLIKKAATEEGEQEVKKGLMRFRVWSQGDLITNFDIMDNKDLMNAIDRLPDYAIDILKESMDRKLSD